MNYIFIFLASLAHLHLYSTFQTTPQSTFINKDGYKEIYYKLEQQTLLDHCRIHVNKTAMYICQDKAYIFEGDTHGKQFSEMLANIPSVIDAAMDSGNVAILGSSNVTFVDESGVTDCEYFDDEEPVLVRLKTKKNFALVITIFHPIFDPIKPKLAENETTTDRDYPKSASDIFVIRSYMRGFITRTHNIKVPTESLDFQLKRTSFEDAFIFTDAMFGHDYFIVTLEKGRILVYKTLFDDPQMELIQNQVFKEGYEIKSMAHSDNLVFFILENMQDNQFIFEIYRINTIGQFNLQQKCSLNLGVYSSLSPSPEIKVKSIAKTIIALINFPGKYIIAYHVQKPTKEYLPFSCPMRANEVTYSNIPSNGTIGYSFDYVINPHPSGLSEQGILLSPFNAGSNASFFIPYCMLNYYMTSGGDCLPCLNSLSRGGVSAKCLPCDYLIDIYHKLIPNQDPMVETCPMVCKFTKKFGKDCEPCHEYLENSRAILPYNASWGLDSQNECSFTCKNGYSDKQSGTCLNTQEFTIMNNTCSQITDCLNCTLSQSCSWCGNSCQPFSVCNPNKVSKEQNFMNDYLIAALQCDMDKPCGQRVYKANSGNFTFGEDAIYKNQFCLWYMESQSKETNEIQLRVHSNTIAKHPWNNPPLLLMRNCLGQIYHMKDCQVTKIALKEGEWLNFTGTDIIFFAWIEESIPYGAQTFSLEYHLTPNVDTFDEVFTFVKLCSHFLLICLLFTCILATFQRIHTIHRRRTLMRQIQGLDVFRLVENDENGAHSLNIDEILENDRIVSRVVYETNASDFEQIECSICLENFSNEEPLAKLTCKHLFHIECFKDWVKSVDVHQRVKCPVCNRVLQ